MAISRDTEREARMLHDIIQRFHPSAKHILDLGCGIGRHAGILSQAWGYSVTGVDLSKDMLCLARQRYPTCIFYHGDMRTIQVNNIFDIVTNMWTTFNYLSNIHDTEVFFKNVYNHLHEEGLIIIDLKNYKNIDISYVRESKNNDFQIKVMIQKQIVQGYNEAIYKYEISNLKTGETEYYTDQEIAKIYDVSQVTELTSPFFSPIAFLGDYDIEAKYIPDSSERIIAILKRQNL